MNTRTRKMILAAAIIVFAAAVIYSIWLALTRKNTAELYLEAEKKEFAKFVDKIEEKYTSMKNKYQPYMEQAYSSRTELSLKVPGGLESFGFSDADTVRDILDKTKLIVKTRNDPVKGISDTEANLLLERAPFLNARLYSDPRTIWLSIPDFLPDRYFSVQRSDLEGLYDRFSIPVKPLKLISGKEIAASLSFDGKSIRESADKLADIWAGYLTDDTVIDNGTENVKFGADGQETEGSEVLIKLDEEKATSLLKELLTAVADDDVLLAYTYGNFANLSELADDAGLFRLFRYLDETGAATLSDYEREILAKLNVRKDIEGFRESLKKTAQSYRLRNGIEMRVVLDKEGDIIYRAVSLDFISNTGGKSFRADISTTGGDTGSRLFELILAEYDMGSMSDIKRLTELNVDSRLNETKDSQKEGEINIRYVITEGSEKTGIDIGIDVSDKTDNQTMKRIRSINAEADIS
ncbi:MAG TPA: hypothetical protein PLG72_03715, partial [Clostridiales bacterium]|nr:hypothetical protein [Clostridiales bacterium]